MAMMTIIIKNTTAADVQISDRGIDIPASGQITMSDQFAFERMADSDDLKTLITAGTLVLNDGSADLSIARAIKFLTFVHKDFLSENHYTKTELSTSGQSTIHFGNLTNVPSFGAARWTDRVLYRVATIGATPPASPAVGTIYVDTDDMHYYRWDGTDWVDLGAALSGDRVIKLDDTEESVYTFNGITAWEDQGAPLADTGVNVHNDGDGKQAQYVYNLDELSWKKIADIDFDGLIAAAQAAADAAQAAADAAQADIDGHMDGGANKHDASEIDVENDYINLGIDAPTDLESALGDIDTAVGALGTSINNVTLDKAYDGPTGSGSGRTINADSGPVKIITTGTQAGFELVPAATLPSVSPLGGQFHVDQATGIVYVYNAVKGKWLSISTFMIEFGRIGDSQNQYLDFFSGGTASNKSGLRMLRNACIIGASAQLDASGTCTLQVRKNDVATAIYSLAVTASNNAGDTAPNVNLNAGEYLQAYVSSTAKVTAPQFMLEIAWRL